MGRKLTDSNRLSFTHPEVAAEWHPCKNGNMTAEDVSFGSEKKVWWLCRECGYEWETAIRRRTKLGRGCHACAGYVVTDSNNLAVEFPEIADQWHPSKNGDLTPEVVHKGSNKKAWWLCRECRHEWEATVSSRTGRRSGCPACAGQVVTDRNNLAVACPGVAAEWHSTKNGDLTPEVVHGGSNKKAWWTCSLCEHDWEAVISSRTGQGTGCPACAGRVVTDLNRLSLTYPEVAGQWHPVLNGDLTSNDVQHGSHKKAWWLCPDPECGHEWFAVIKSRTRIGAGCPVCKRGGRKLTDTNRLSILYPGISSEWHTSKNGDLTAEDVYYGSAKRVWWSCAKCAHEWETVIGKRTREGIGCPACAGKVVTDRNSLEVAFPEVAAQWHPTLNGNLTPDRVHRGANKKAWWLCPRCGHSWEAAISSRTWAGSGCPACAGMAVTDHNNLEVAYPKIAAQWHPVLNGDLTPDQVYKGNEKKAWWLCELGHEWESLISSRTRQGYGCPGCILSHRSEPEVRLACELSTFFPEIDPTQNYKLSIPDGKPFLIDIAAPSLKLAIEYDGSYWHKDKAGKDREKVKRLKAAGWSVLRIREEPLELIQATDLLYPSPYPYDFKYLTDLALIHLRDVFGLEIPGIDEYLDRDDLANEALADSIIELLKSADKSDGLVPIQLQFPWSA